MDWSYGRIFAVHLEPDGASYRGKAETFLRGTPLNLTDLAFGPDGALYFITGGRGTQSGLYRVSYTGGATSTAPLAKTSSSDPAARARALRHQLERFHGRADDAAVDFLWPHLASSDRFIRSAARLALESQPAVSWRERALAETHAGTALSALLALARVSGTEVQRDLLKALARFPLDALSESDQLRKLRVIELSFLRQGRPQGDLAALAISQLDRHFPATSWPLNRELSRLLLWLEAPGAVNKTLDLLGTAPTQEQQLHYIAQLRNVPQGWTPAARRRFLEWWLKPRDALAHPPEVFGWFADAGRGYVDGAWVDRYLREFHRDAVAALSAQERTELAGLLNRPLQKARQIPSTIRAHVRQWTMADLLPHLDEAGAGRDFERGRRAFADAQCLACHRFGNDGGAIGPELTAAGSKYDRRSLLESILEPSKVVSEQYQHSLVVLKNGDSFSGRLIRDAADEIVLETDPASGASERIARVRIDTVTPSTLSPMPEGLVNSLTREEILDLLAYLESGGRAAAAAFKSRPRE
jgi:putative heme-binding domain-containing protein